MKTMNTSILLTGGTGFIGSHTAVELINAGYEVILADNLSNSDKSVVRRIAEITGCYPTFYELDVADHSALDDLFFDAKKAGKPIDAVIHFAGAKAVGESVSQPLYYYTNNLNTTTTLLSVMRMHGCRKLIFSSSATVYGDNSEPPFIENSPAGNCTNPYGWTKYMNEIILTDVAKADDRLSVVLLRYFNPVGAHPSGLIGENPKGIPNNLMPYITQTAAGIRECLSVYGNDYDTPDGTGVRDYIHVVDLAKGHVAALRYAEKEKGVQVFNLGTGRGCSVLEVISAFEKANGLQLNYRIAERRPGDVASCYADASKAEKLLGWKAELGIEDMCRDAWKWENRS